MLKHGDINYATGMVFWSHDSGGRERWMDPARFLFRKNMAHRNSRIRYALNIEESRRKVREYARMNKSMKSASFKKWSEKNKDKTRDSRLKRTYGISSLDYERMFLAQNGKCAICSEKQSAITKKSGTSHFLCVDHCHKTGKVRGLLCVNCNIAIGKFKDNPSLMIKASEYIKEQLSEQEAVVELRVS